METRKLKRCKKCGVLERWDDMKNECLFCKNTTYDEVEYPQCSEEDEEFIYTLEQDVFYIINKEFSKIKPNELDCFGCIEMCEHLKKEYDLSEDVYELIGIINQYISWLENSELHSATANMISRYLNIQLDDGRLVDYTLVYYNIESDNEIPDYLECSENSIQEFELDTKAKIENLIECARNLKKYTTGYSPGDTMNDYDFSLSDMKKARTHVLNLIKPRIERDKQEEERKKQAEIRNALVEKITQPLENTDPNYIKSATCPNCHKNSVYRISNVKRATSIGLFGMFSKNIAKTMECRSCGYKW